MHNGADPLEKTIDRKDAGIKDPKRLAALMSVTIVAYVTRKLERPPPGTSLIPRDIHCVSRRT